jgi:hypothetical protein
VANLRLYAEDAFLLRHAIANYAGAEAVRHWKPRRKNWRDGADTDYEDAVDRINEITSDPESIDLLYKYAKRRCQLLVRTAPRQGGVAATASPGYCCAIAAAGAERLVAPALSGAALNSRRAVANGSAAIHPRDYVPAMLRCWAAQKKRAMSGVRRFADGSVHVDGFNSTSATAGVFQGVGSAKRQRFDEVYTGDGLTIWRIYSDAPLEVREILFAHFIASGRAWRKARELNISVPTYWKRLDSAYYYIAGRLDRDDRRAQQLAGGG